MRIISGKYRGKLLHPGKKFSARPTTDFAKESLFNIIGNNFDIETLRVLDLFSGTGSISFEFASRGCARIDSVELNYSHFSFINRTSKELDFQQMNVYRADAFAFIKKCTTIYDLIFADPPFDLPDLHTLPELVFSRNILGNDGWFILEHSGSYDFQELVSFRQLRKYGKVNFSIFAKGS